MGWVISLKNMSLDLRPKKFIGDFVKTRKEHNFPGFFIKNMLRINVESSDFGQVNQGLKKLADIHAQELKLEKNA